MRRFLVVIVLAGCVEPVPPPAPSAAMQKLQSACDRGDTASCKTIVEMEQREKESIRAMPPPQVSLPPMNPQDFMTGARMEPGQSIYPGYCDYRYVPPICF